MKRLIRCPASLVEPASLCKRAARAAPSLDFSKLTQGESPGRMLLPGLAAARVLAVARLANLARFAGPTDFLRADYSADLALPTGA
jgi:hypothetical protein